MPTDIAPRPWQRDEDFGVMDHSGNRVVHCWFGRSAAALSYAEEVQRVIIRRVNAHEGLVAACENALLILDAVTSVTFNPDYPHRTHEDFLIVCEGLDAALKAANEHKP